MSYAEDFNHDLDPEFLGLSLYGSDYDLDSERLEKGEEFIEITVWRMRDGSLIAIKDMTTSHIKNCIKMIHRSGDTWRREYVKYLESELKRRGILPDPIPVIYIQL